MKDQLRETQLQRLEVPPLLFSHFHLCFFSASEEKKVAISVTEEKGHVLYHIFFLDYFNVSDRIRSTKILVGKKRKKNKLPNNPVG